MKPNSPACERNHHSLEIQCRSHDQSFQMETNHYHDEYEIYYQISGDRYFFTGGKFLHLHQGTLVWIDKYDIHQSFQGDLPSGSRAVIYFTETFLRNLFQQHTDRLLALFTGAFRIMCLDGRWQKKILELMYEIEQAQQKNRDLYAGFVFGQLILLLEEWTENCGTEVPSAEHTAPKYERISKVLSYLKNHVSERIRLEDTAREFFVTPYYLSRTFKECTGITFVSYVNHLKVEAAKELLRNNMSVTQTGLELGFETVTHFERVFKSATGLSPSDWKKSQRPLRAAGQDKIG